MTDLEVHDRQGVGSGEAQQAQDLEHLHGGDQGAAALLQDIGAGHNVALLGREGGRHGRVPGLHHLHLRGEVGRGETQTQLSRVGMAGGGGQGGEVSKSHGWVHMLSGTQSSETHC